MSGPTRSATRICEHGLDEGRNRCTAGDARASNVSELRERVDEGDRDGTLRRRPREGVADPRVEHDEARVRLCHEKPVRI